jgi:hypothetical protein
MQIHWPFPIARLETAFYLDGYDQRQIKRCARCTESSQIWRALKNLPNEVRDQSKHRKKEKAGEEKKVGGELGRLNLFLIHRSLSMHSCPFLHRADRNYFDAAAFFAGRRLADGRTIPIPADGLGSLEIGAELCVAVERWL